MTCRFLHFPANTPTWGEHESQEHFLKRLSSLGDFAFTDIISAHINEEYNSGNYLTLELPLEWQDRIMQNDYIKMIRDNQFDIFYRVDKITRKIGTISVHAYIGGMETLKVPFSYNYEYMYGSDYQILQEMQDIVELWGRRDRYNNEFCRMQLGYSIEQLFPHFYKSKKGLLVADNLLPFCNESGYQVSFNSMGIFVDKPSEIETGAFIISRVNMTDIEYDIDASNVVKGIYPIGQDGIVPDTPYIEAEIVPMYGKVEIKEFKQYIDKSRYNTEADYISAVKEDLVYKAKLYLLQNCVPKVTYKIKGELLTDLMRGIGTRIKVIDEFHDLNMTAVVKAYTYDALADRYTDITLGNFTQNLQGLYFDLKNRIDWQDTTQTIYTNTSVNNMATASKIYNGDMSLGSGVSLPTLKNYRYMAISYRPGASDSATWQWAIVPVNEEVFTLNYIAPESGIWYGSFVNVKYNKSSGILQAIDGAYVKISNGTWQGNWTNMHVNQVLGLAIQGE